MKATPQQIGSATALNLEVLGVALNVKGGLDMAKITLNLPDDDSANGVTLETLDAYAKARGFRNVEECINRLIAGNLGYRPDAEGENTPLLPGLANLFKDIDK